MLQPGSHPAAPARQLPVPPKEFPSWRGRASCLGSGTQFLLFSLFHRLSQTAVSTRFSSIPRRCSAQHLLGTCSPMVIFSFSTSSSFLDSREHQLMFRRQPLTLQKPWTTPLRGVDEVLALMHPAAHQPPQPVLGARELALWDYHWETGDRGADASMKCSPPGIRALLGAGTGCAALGMSPAGWLQLPGEDKARATYLPRCLAASRAPCIPLIQRCSPRREPSNYSFL